MSVTFEELVTAFLADTAYQAEHQGLVRQREATLPRLQTIIRDFVNEHTHLQEFRDGLAQIIRPGSDAWFAQGRFMMELNKFIKNHGISTIEPVLRRLLTGLNETNMGQRIEQLYQFALGERERLRNQGVGGNSIVAPGNSALIISFFAVWLEPYSDKTILYNSDMRKGLYYLYKENLVTLLTPDFRFNIGNNVIEIITDKDHQAFIHATIELLLAAPRLRISDYWADSFLFWVNSYFKASNPVIKESSSSEAVLTGTSRSASEVKEPSALYSAEQFLKNDPLLPASERVFSRLIREVQRHILVDESVIRRVYHALLAGHMILSGPPGTGKTELARLIPEILWQRPENEEDGYDPEEIALTKSTAYTTSLVTATDEWSVRTLISGIAPVSKNGTVAYSVKYGYLTSAILQNWSAQGHVPEEWDTLVLRRSSVVSSSGVERGTPQTFRGQWLVIDEFNRAPIDLALGDALTALGGNDVLRVAIEGGSAELPIPKDFRVIGTLNSFDRNYLNQISEALKRRFSFVEILPPGRSLRAAEQAIVLYKALERVSHLSKSIVAENDVISWETITVEAEPEGQYIITWPDTWADDRDGFYVAFETAWCLLDIIRIYRQLGTAQAISLTRHMLIAGILQDYTTRNEWMSALDAALCDTIADQLQVLLPDEIDALLLTLTHTHNKFREAYNRLLANLADRPQRLYGQLLALSRVNDENGAPYLTDEEVETIAQSNQPTIVPEKLDGLFHLLSFNKPAFQLPQFTRRLRAFKTERGL